MGFFFLREELTCILVLYPGFLTQSLFAAILKNLEYPDFSPQLQDDNLVRKALIGGYYILCG